MNEHHDSDWNDRIRGALDAEADAVARRHGDRLAEARRAALAERPASEASRWTVMLPIAASVAVVARAAALLMPGGSGPEPMPMTDDLDLLASETFDLASDEPAFYAWLAEQDLDEVPERSG
jgi:hypothetical protein